MNQREKILAVAFGLVIVFWFGRPIFNHRFVEPVTQRKAQKSGLQEKVKNLEFQQMQLLSAQQRVADETRRALPPEELKAQRLYQEWVTELANLYHFRDLEVKPEGRSSSKKVYSSVRVGVTALANYEQLCRFLASFENADILHRISSLHLECKEHLVNPLIEISLTAEALTMPESPMRDSVFPRFYLLQPVTADTTTFAPLTTEGFPEKEPFVVRVGDELIEVTPTSNQVWNLKRGYEATTASTHLPGAEVELFKLREDRPLISAEQFDNIIKENFFLKPVEPVDYNPRFIVQDQVLIRGNPLRFQVRAEDFPPETPPRLFAVIGDTPPGFELKADTGEVTWDPSESVEVGQYSVTLAVRVEGEDEPALPPQEVKLTLKEPNLKPVLSEIEPQTVIPGTQFTLKLDAFDFETLEEDLQFSMEGNIPEGAQIDRQKGIITWDPPEVALPADYDFTVSVTDRGDPPQTATRPVKLSVIEDLTRDTYLTGIISPDNNMKAMLYNRAEDKTTILKEGEPFEVAGVKGQVLMIGRDFVLWQAGESMWQLYVGKNLHSRSKASLGGL